MSGGPSDAELRLPMLLAMAGTGSMLAHQVASKAARDGFFLQQFEPTDLPKMVAAAALVSFALAVLFSRLTERLGTARMVPGSFLLSAALHAGEWMALGTAPRLTVAFIYLHVVGLGAILLSGFWLLLSEVFDLREAKKRFGRIAGIGTAGGIAGGIIAERIVAWWGSDYLLPMLAVLHLACAFIAFRLRPANRKAPRFTTPPVSVRQAFTQTPLLWQLATLVFLGTCTAALLDYLFKLGAAQSIGKGPMLVRYFAYYYTGCQILTFLVQTLMSRSVVERLGIARSVASLPVAVGLGSTAALLVPIYPLVIVVRALEVILRGSLFRTGYEFLYTPVPPADKRAVKTIVDVGFDRMGDAVGAGAVQVMMWLGPTLARPEILGLAMVLTAISTTLAFRLEASYRGVLERGLVARAREEDDSDTDGDSISNTFFEGMPSLGPLRPIGQKTEEAEPARALPARPDLDPSTERLAELRSRNAQRVLHVLREGRDWDPLLVPQVIRLLAWDEVSIAAREYLERGHRLILGQIIDALTDQDMDFGIRRRLPRLLARVPEQRSVDGLVRSLEDPRFEIRYQCGRALEFLKRRHQELDFLESAVMAAAGRELAVSQTIWTSRRRLDGKDNPEHSTDSYDFLDDVLRDRADRSLEHVFSLFAVVLPREPLMAAFRALHQEDRMFRGLALEYLETTLPEDIRKRLWVVIEESPPEVQGNLDPREVMQSLLETNAAALAQLRQAAKSNPPADSAS